MSSYDDVALVYDQHFHRDVDFCEDGRLADLLRPLVDGRSVLDLGCGTGWVVQHCHPADYTGVDASAGMLAVLHAKRRGQVQLVKAEVGAPGWRAELPAGHWGAITATWAADYFPHLPLLLYDLAGLGPEVIALHGATPRGHRRRHFINPDMPYQRWSPRVIRQATRDAGLPAPQLYGIGAADDHSLLIWDLTLRLPPAWHYSILAVWQLGAP